MTDLLWIWCILLHWFWVMILCIYGGKGTTDSLALEPSHTWNISGLFALSEKISFAARTKYYPHFTCGVV